MNTNKLKVYEGIPNLVRKLFVEYLTKIVQDRRKENYFHKIEPVEMGWKTVNNGVDCGVFVMRHMETFPGNGMKD